MTKQDINLSANVIIPLEKYNYLISLVPKETKEKTVIKDDLEHTLLYPTEIVEKVETNPFEKVAINQPLMTKGWSKAEENVIHRGARANLDIDELVEILSPRTVRSIKSKLFRLGYNIKYNKVIIK